MKVKTIKQRHDVGLWLELTTEMNGGRVVVNLRHDDGCDDGTLLTATEARTLSRALHAFADEADRKNKRKGS